MPRRLCILYRTPSSQPGDLTGWLDNQAAHALIVGGDAALLFWWLGLPRPALVAALFAG